MKKILLTVAAIFIMVSTSVFGMYGIVENAWIDFLVHGNQFRARANQLGFTLGNGTIKGTFGFKANTGLLGSIVGSGRYNVLDAFNPTVSAGIGYTSEMIGVGVGYNFTYVDKQKQVHTPVLVLNALNNNLRIAVPIQVAVYERASGSTLKYTDIGFNNLQLRFFTGIDAFNAIRVLAYYRSSRWESKEFNYLEEKMENFGLQLRFYFAKTQVGNVTVNPYLRLEYHTSIHGGSLSGGGDAFGNPGGYGIADNVWTADYNTTGAPHRIVVMPTLTLTAKNDIITLYFEPSIGYTAVITEYAATKKTTHSVAWGIYSELYIRASDDLEFYVEAGLNNLAKSVSSGSALTFDGNCGITWYLPSLN